MASLVAPCPVDPTQWGKDNRVRLFKGKRNVWVLARTLADRPSTGWLDYVTLTTRAVMAKWFHGYALDTVFADASDAADDVQVLRISDSRPSVRAAAQRREQMDPVPTLRPDAGIIYVTVAFNYRGFATEMPWPVWGSASSVLRAAKLCPFGADWMLVQTTSEDALAASPPPKSPLEKLRDPKSPLGGAFDALGDLVTLGKWALVAYVGFQAWRVVGPSVRGGIRDVRAQRAAERSRAA